MIDWSRRTIRADADALVNEPVGYFQRCRAQIAVTVREQVREEIDQLVIARRADKRAARRRRLTRLISWRQS